MQKIFGLCKKAGQVLSFFIAPPVCYICHCYLFDRAVLCRVCCMQLLPIAPKILKINQRYSMTVHAVCRYDGIIKKLVLAKHYSDHVALQGLAELMWQKTIISYLKVDCFIPIPLHWTRRLRRGFNQAELLAQYLAKQKRCNMYNMVTRVKRTGYQAQLEKNERHDNVKDAFEVKGDFDIEGKHIMLVDDLCTTGSTAVAVAKSLAPYKPASISLIVACRAL